MFEFACIIDQFARKHYVNITITYDSETGIYQLYMTQEINGRKIGVKRMISQYSCMGLLMSPDENLSQTLRDMYKELLKYREKKDG